MFGRSAGVSETARRLAAILLLEPALDASYQTVKQAVYARTG
jgi:hypothetical protein